MTSTTQTDPEQITSSHQARWDERAERIGTRVEVSPCPYGADELAAFEGAGRRVAFLPAGLATQGDRWKLGAMFPKMGSYAVLPDNPVTNDASPAGWFDYESTATAPYARTDEAELLDRLREDGRTLLTLNQYIVASQDTHATSGRYLDETTAWVRLGSRFDGRLVCALIDGDGQVEGFPEVPVEGSLRVAHDVHAQLRGRTGARSTSATPKQCIVVPEPPGHHPVPPPSAAEAFCPAVFDLDAEWERMVGIYLRIGVHRELGVSEGEYRASLPRLSPQPAEYAGRFDVPLLVETRLDWEHLGRLVGCQMSILRRGVVFSPADERSAAPSAPYAGWFNMWGRRFVDPIAPADARRQLVADEVGGSVHDVIAMELVRPQLSANARYFEAVGYVAGPIDIPELSNDLATLQRTPMINRTRRDEAQLSTNLHPIAYSTFRPLVRGVAITTARR